MVKAAGGHMVAVVQLVEHLVVVQDVAGSSPVSHPIWVRCEIATKGSPAVEVSAWPYFFIWGPSSRCRSASQGR